jgi:hypothetical protein
VTLAILFAAALSLPSSAQAIRVAPDTWPSTVDISRVEVPTAGEKLYWWSSDCAPAKVTFESPQVSCGATRIAVTRVLDEQGRNVAGAKIVWGTMEMLADLPETMLPFATSGDDGTVRLLLPARDAVLVRVAGARVASWWQRVAATQVAISIRASEATTVSTKVQLSGGGIAARSIIEIEPISVVSAADDVRSWGASERGVIALLPLPRMPVRYTAWSDEASPQTGIASTVGFPRAISLARGGSVEGRLIGSKRFLNDATVEAVFRLPGASRGLRRRARSEANGHFAVRGLAAGQVQLVARKAGFATVLRMLKVEGGVTIDEDIVMKPARTVTVHVIDRSGRPAPSADVRTSDGVHAVTDKDGLAAIDGVPAGEAVQLSVRAHSFHAASVVVPADSKGRVDIVLSRGVRVLAKIYKAGTREPAGPGNVMITNNGGKRIEPFDSSGQIDIGGLDSGTLGLEIRATGAAPLSVAARTVRDDEEVNLGELSLPRGAAMTGHLTARSSGAPIANGHIKALRRGASGPVMSFVMRDWVEATSGDDGTFAVAGVQPGPQVLLVEANGFSSRIVTADVREDAEAPVDLGSVDLDQARELIVNCTPARRCGSEARVLLASAEFPWASVSGRMQDGTADILSAPSGTVTLRLLADGRIVEERSIDVSSQSDATTVDIKLLSTNVTGTVVSSSRPRAGGRVMLERASGGDHVIPVYLESRTPEGQVASSGAVTDMPEMQTANVDGAGRFAFTDVRPGVYHATYRHDGTTAPSMQVTVPEMEKYDFTIDLPGGEIRGRVVDADAAPVSRAIVEVRDATGQSQVAASDESGEFSISGIAPGHAVVRATRSEREGNAEAEIEPPRAATVEVVLRPKEQTKSEIAVSTPNGQPLSGAVVFLLGSGPFPAGVATTDGGGIATFQLAEPVILPAAAYSPSYGWSWMGPKSVGSADSSLAPMQMSASTGTLVVSSAKRANIELFTQSGIAVAAAFSMLGVPVTTAPGNDLRLSGLPPGTYTLQAGAFRASAEVTAGKDARVSIR